MRKNERVTILPYAARTVGLASSHFYNKWYRGLIITIDVTAVPGDAGTITSVGIQQYVGPYGELTNLGPLEDDANYVTVYSFGSLAIKTVGKHVLVLHPNTLVATGGLKGAVAGVLPVNFKIVVAHVADGKSITYGIGGELVVA